MDSSGIVDVISSISVFLLGATGYCCPRRGPHVFPLRYPFPNDHFNPCPPRRGRPVYNLRKGTYTAFQSTSPHRGRLFVVRALFDMLAYFNPCPRVGDDPIKPQASPPETEFQSTSPRRGRRPTIKRRNRCRQISIHVPA